MSFLIRSSLLCSVLLMALGLGGASQRIVSGHLVIIIVALAAVLGLFAALLAILLILVKPGAESRADYETPITAILSLVYGVLIIGGTGFVYVVHVMPYPWLADITTNFESPPEFRSVTAGIAAIEGEEFISPSNSSNFYDPENEPKQKAAYPDIGPLILKHPKDITARAAVVAANQMEGWQLGASDEKEGRVEASLTIGALNFPEEIVILISATPEGGSRVDARSRSRGSPVDQGSNASRIRAFFKRLIPAADRMAERQAARLAAEAAKAAAESSPAPPATADPMGAPAATPASPPTTN